MRYTLTFDLYPDLCISRGRFTAANARRSRRLTGLEVRVLRKESIGINRCDEEEGAASGLTENESEVRGRAGA